MRIYVYVQSSFRHFEFQPIIAVMNQSGDAFTSTSTTDFGSRREEKPKQYQSAGLRDRHIDKHMWTAYIRHCTC